MREHLLIAFLSCTLAAIIQESSIIISASPSQSAAYDSSFALDLNPATTYATSTANPYVELTLGAAYTISGYFMSTYQLHPLFVSRSPRSWTVRCEQQGSQGWIVIDTRTEEINNAEILPRFTPASTDATCIRVLIEFNNSLGVAVSDIALEGDWTSINACYDIEKLL